MMRWMQYGMPWGLGGMMRLQEEMNRLFDESIGLGSHGYPAMNAWVSDEDVVLEAEVPGVKPDDLDISVQADTVTLSGERKQEPCKEGEFYHRQERDTGRFCRSFTLPFKVDAAKAEARFKSGVVRIRLPRAEEDKPRKISVKVA